jgi:dihydropteroate synthase
VLTLFIYICGVKDSAFYTDESMQINGRLVVFNKPLTMAIINLTSDSFHAGSRASDVSEALKMASDMVSAGADILDIGAYSTRPGADDIPEALELETLTKAIEAIKSHLPQTTISVDTFRSSVAKACVECGAHMVNDVGSGILDPTMFQTVAELRVPYILMHNRGTPKDMAKLNNYSDVVNEVVKELSEKVNRLRNLGIKDIIIDPGFGFAKNVEQNYEMLMRLGEFKILGCPILVGISRKSMIWRTLGSGPEDALNGTTALHMLALERGASILRVHDVKEAKESIKIWQACEKYQETKYPQHGLNNGYE